jgi:hypothetical protein
MRTIMILPLLLLAARLAQPPQSSPSTMPATKEVPRMQARLISAKRIWDQAPHNAFTDLIAWKGKFWCAFREGRSHVSSDGTIRVLVSDDLEAWTSAALLGKAGLDLRDAGLSVTPEGQLMVIGGAAPRPRDGVLVPTGSFVAFSKDGQTFSPPEIVMQPGRWLWRVTWHGGKAYGVSYPADEGKGISLHVSNDGRKWDTLAAELYNSGEPNEATLRFDDDDTAYMILRRERANAALGLAKPPYKEWTWQVLSTPLGGPNILRTPLGWVAAGRISVPAAARATGPAATSASTPPTTPATRRVNVPATGLLAIDPSAGAGQVILKLPSGGDTSYPGLLWHDGRLVMSYYSSHQGRTAIYLAKIEIH